MISLVTLFLLSFAQIENSVAQVGSDVAQPESSVDQPQITIQQPNGPAAETGIKVRVEVSIPRDADGCAFHMSRTQPIEFAENGRVAFETRIQPNGNNYLDVSALYRDPSGRDSSYDKTITSRFFLDVVGGKIHPHLVQGNVGMFELRVARIR